MLFALSLLQRSLLALLLLQPLLLLLNALLLLNPLLLLPLLLLKALLLRLALLLLILALFFLLALLLKLLLNAAHCYIKLQWPRKACTACKEALQIEENTKALYRFGKAKRMLEDLEAARSLLIKAQRKAPHDMSISDELRSLEDQVVKEREKEKLLCTNMFGKMKSKRKEDIPKDSEEI